MSDASDLVIDVKNLSKVYRIPRSGHRKLAGSLSLVFNNLIRRPEKVPRGYYAFEALKPMDLKIRKGEAVGIIGRNGSGKSTLLQLVTGTLGATTGQVRINGSISALLELGSGFSMEYTGIENIYLNGAILGMSRKHIEEKLDDILEFADIGDFIHQPLKTYSSGMNIRLAFSVLIAANPEVLILDEALAVGDIFFQSKCAQWLEKYVARGGSLLCVSHDMFLLQRLCRRGILMEKGEMLLDGSIADAATLYYKLQQQSSNGSADECVREDATDSDAVVIEEGQCEEVEIRTKSRTGTGDLEITALRTSRNLLKDCQVGDWVTFEVDVTARREVADVELGIGFRDRSGQLVAGYHSHFTEEGSFSMEANQRYQLSVDVQLLLKPRPYLLMVGLGLTRSTEVWEDYDTMWDCAQVMVHGERKFWGQAPTPYRNFEIKELAR
jgi:ABC-type polysaccharide/polyol phosphate transport system ATPase subunit